MMGTAISSQLVLSCVTQQGTSHGANRPMSRIPLQFLPLGPLPHHPSDGLQMEAEINPRLPLVAFGFGVYSSNRRRNSLGANHTHITIKAKGREAKL